MKTSNTIDHQSELSSDTICPADNIIVPLYGSSDSEIWSQVLEELSHQLKKPSFETWIKPIAYRGIKDNYAILAVRNEFGRSLILQCYQNEIQTALKEITGTALGLRIIIDPSIITPPSESTTEQQSIASLQNKIEKVQQNYQNRNSLKTNLIKELNCDNFINASNNEIASVFSKALIDNPNSSYKSLFIHSESGLGKTHLLHALGNYGLSKNPDLRIKYINAEDFTNQLIIAIQKNQTQEFRTQFRNLDVLLFDDLQFLINKKACQEEFYYSFDALINKGAKVFITANCKIQSLNKLDSRIISRLNSALVAEIQDYSFESRLKILELKANTAQLQIQTQYLELIARKYSSNIRELEGAILQLNAQQSFLDKNIDHALISELFGGLSQADNQGLSIEQIANAVAEYFAIKSNELKSKKRSQDITRPRHIAIYLTHKSLGLSYKRIGDFFGSRKHSSVIHSIKLIESELNSNLPSARGMQVILDDIRKDLNLQR